MNVNAKLVKKVPALQIFSDLLSTILILLIGIKNSFNVMEII
jgi:hypothetical protein